MRVLVVAEKPSFADRLLDSIQRVRPWPGAEIAVVFTGWLGLFSYRFPNALRMRDLPHAAEVRLRPGYPVPWGADWQGWPVYRGVCGDPGGLAGSAGVPGAEPWRHGFWTDPAVRRDLRDPARLEAALARLLAESHLVVDFTDTWPSSAAAFRDIARLAPVLSGVGGRGAPRLLDVRLDSTAPRHLDRIALDLGDRRHRGADSPVFEWDPDSALLRQADARRFFDYNWAVNAGALIGAPLRAAGVPPSLAGRAGEPRVAAASLVSKYSLLLLLHLAGGGADPVWSESRIIAAMAEWRGTGKYRDRGTGLGGSASRSHILENLRQLGLLEDVGAPAGASGGRLRVSGRGHALAGLLPKLAYDPDLPARIAGWADAWPESRPRVEAYLRRYWGAIKRSNGMRSLCADTASMTLLEAASALGDRGGAVHRAQVPASAIEAALAGQSLPPRQERAIRLAARRALLELGSGGDADSGCAPLSLSGHGA